VASRDWCDRLSKFFLHAAFFFAEAADGADDPLRAVIIIVAVMTRLFQVSRAISFGEEIFVGLSLRRRLPFVGRDPVRTLGFSSNTTSSSEVN